LKPFPEDPSTLFAFAVEACTGNSGSPVIINSMSDGLGGQVIGMATLASCAFGNLRNTGTAANHPGLTAAISTICAMPFTPPEPGGGFPAFHWGDVNNTGEVDIADVLCALDAFSGCFESCPPSGCGGGCICSNCFYDLVPCPPDGNIDVGDVTAILDAYSGSKPCPCTGGSQALSSPEPHAQLSLSLRSGGVVGSILIDVFADVFSGMRCYELKLVAGGGLEGRLMLEGMSFEPPPGEESALAGLEGYSAINSTEGRLMSCLVQNTVTTTARRHLATFRFRFSPDALGVFTLQLAPSHTQLLDRFGRRINLHGSTWTPLLVRRP
jgi:hypothetical protein